MGSNWTLNPGPASALIDTQVELARRLGKPQSFVSAYESGQRRVDVIEFILIARTLAAKPLEILTKIVASIPA